MPLTTITLDPGVMGGKPCIRGLRVTVGAIVGLVASGRTIAEILAAYPYLEETASARRSLMPLGGSRRRKPDWRMIRLIIEVGLSPLG